jgi:cyclopropane fatty-acyl-phospholipid synthase-like methyltransferase
MTDARLQSPSAARNRDPILTVLRRHLDGMESVLEIASGSGEHVVHFAAALPGITFQPTDPDAPSRASIDAWVSEIGLANVRPALALDVTAPPWPVAQADAVVCINMIHISPWAATLALMRGAAQVLPADGVLFLYGPYRRGGAHTADSNAAFDANLRGRNPAWGIRDLEAVADAAKAEGFGAPAVVPMPANNFSVIFRRGQSVDGA